MFNLILDGNNLALRSLFINNYNLDEQDGCDEFVKKYLTDLSYQFKKWYSFYDNVYITIDYKSWRKKEKLYETDEKQYKANRTGHNINWDNFHNSVNNVYNLLEKYGCHIVKIDGAEGDDIMTVIGEHKNNLILTADKDLLQLVDYKKRLNCIYSPISKVIYFHQDFDFNVNKKFENVYDIFSYEGNEFESSFINFINLENLKIEKVNPVIAILEKIVLGDSSDNIFKIQKGFGIKSLEKIIEKLNIKDLKNRETFLNENFIESIVDEILNVKKNINDKENYLKIINYNIKLIFLHKKIIPNEIWENIETYIKENKKRLLKDEIKNSYNLINKVFNTNEVKYADIFSNFN